MERQPLLGGPGGKSEGERVGSIWRSFVMVAALGALLTTYGQLYGLGARASLDIRSSKTASQLAMPREGRVSDLGGSIAASPILGSPPAARSTDAPILANGSRAGDSRFAVAERYRSIGKLQLYHGGDLEAPGELERAVAMRSYNGELVLTYANEAGTAWAANLIFSLRDIGIDHTMVILMGKEHCDAMATSRHHISCGWSSWDMEGCKADDGPVPKWAFIERLWFIRHHYLARLVRLRVNVMALDGDMIVHGDPYAVLHSVPLGKHNMVITSDGAFAASEVNNGFLYLRNCSPGGQVERVLREVIMREMDVCRGGDRVFGVNGTFWQPLDQAGITAGPHHIAFTGARDQKYYQDVLASAFCARKVIHRMPFSSHKVLDGRRFDDLLAGRDIRSCTLFREPPTRQELLTGHSAGGGPQRVPWHELSLPLSRAGMGSVVPDRDGAALPGAPEPARETIALLTAPALSTWHGTATGEIAGWSGHWIQTPPMITHFVGCLSKAEAMQSLGWWFYEADDTSADVAARVRGTVPMGAILPSLLKRVRGPEKRMLALDGPQLHAPIHGRRAFLEWQLPQRARLAVLSTQLERAAVEPLVDCRADWIPHFERDYFRIRQAPGWPWPFDDGVGVLMGPCAARRPEGHPPGLCCHPIFGPKINTNWFPERVPTVHNRVLEAAAAELGPATARALAAGESGAHVLRVAVGSVLTTDGQLDVRTLKARLSEAEAARGGAVPIVVLTLDAQAPQLPLIADVPRSAVCAILREACRIYYGEYPRTHPPPDGPS
ncbi:hypothetical protein KFE25_007024 [Diacronema lutheri]|uniref:Nucleotide-diphospho-sugar transferase domain-containing protein n=1 Tax=Diacronema lutheri TaxID=2081491 RepID=A0A8J5XT87_DIALT|nr:hypothetical protein KFE25_007024 [Diacronema lutheri]